MKAVFYSTRWTLVFLILVGVWMTDCQSPTSIQLRLEAATATKDKEKIESLQALLQGCRKPQVPAELASSPEVLKNLLPEQRDRDLVDAELDRDYVFMISYTLAYLSLAGVLWLRPLPFSRWLAGLATVLALVTLYSDYQENRGMQKAMRIIPVVDASAGKPGSDSDQLTAVLAIRRASLAKWYSGFALGAVLSFALLQKRWSIASVAGGALLAGGTLGIVLGGWPKFIEYGFLLELLGGLLAAIAFFRQKNLPDLWPPKIAAP